jgi:uridine phosphorylase
MMKNMRARSSGAATEESLRTRYLGRHTTLSYLFDNKRVWRDIPYLRENEGHAPPIVLAVGDRRRLYSISRSLNKAVLLPETVARRISKRDYRSAPEFGRIAMAIGLISSIPILVVETQMGSPATQIIMNEALSDDLTCLDYRVGRNRITLPHKIVIRVGTAGGINCERKRAVNVGDIVVATHSIGVTGANLQSLHCLDFWRPAAIRKFNESWTSMGEGFTITEAGHPRVNCSEDVFSALEGAARTVAKQHSHAGGNITKDSLYAELGTDMFLELCQTQNCRTTEMEFSAIAVAAREHDAHFGMVSAIVGVLPGDSFTESEKMKTTAEQRAIMVSLEAIRRFHN